MNEFEFNDRPFHKTTLLDCNCVKSRFSFVEIVDIASENFSPHSLVLKQKHYDSSFWLDQKC